MLPKNISALCLLGLALFALAACQTGDATPPAGFDVTVIAPTPGSGYPAPEAGDPPAYPEPQQTSVTPAVEPADNATPDPTLGQVTGRLQLGSAAAAEAVPNRLLYLAEILQDTNGEERAASLDRQASPRAITDAEGAFHFINVKPGRYGLVLDTIIESYLLNDPDSGLSLIISVDSGGTVELGSLIYEDLPLPPE